MWFKAPSADSGWSWDTFISPFDKSMWSVYAANIVVCALVLYATHYFKLRRQRTKEKHGYTANAGKEGCQFDWANSFFASISATVQQGKQLDFCQYAYLYIYDF